MNKLNVISQSYIMFSSTYFDVSHKSKTISNKISSREVTWDKISSDRLIQTK